MSRLPGNHISPSPGAPLRNSLLRWVSTRVIRLVKSGFILLSMCLSHLFCRFLLAVLLLSTRCLGLSILPLKFNHHSVQLNLYHALLQYNAYLSRLHMFSILLVERPARQAGGRVQGYRQNLNRVCAWVTYVAKGGRSCHRGLGNGKAHLLRICIMEFLNGVVYVPSLITLYEMLSGSQGCVRC